MRPLVALLAIGTLLVGCVSSGALRVSAAPGASGASGASGAPDASDAPDAPTAPAEPDRCRQVFNAVRCLAMTDYAAVQLNVRREDIAAIDVLPEPTPVIRDGKTIVGIRSGGPPIDVRVTMTDGTTRLTSMDCGLGSHPACMDDPHLTVSSVTGPNGGYHDIPCSGVPPDGCATPLPTTEPAAAAAARPLTIDRVDIPLDHVGPYEVRLGEASLPNGLLTEASLMLVDDWPPGVSITSGDLSIDVRSLEADGKPFSNFYVHGWREGTERVEALLVFTADHVDRGARLAIRDVVVR